MVTPALPPGFVLDDDVPAPPPGFAVEPARAGLGKRVKANASAAFWGADSDSAGLLSEALIGSARGDQLRDSASRLGTYARIADAVGADTFAGSLRAKQARRKAAADKMLTEFGRQQAERRAAVEALGPADGIVEKGADLAGRFAAGIPQPENFIGGPALSKGTSLGVKVARGALGGAIGNVAVDPFLQAGSIERGMRDRYSLTDTAKSGAFGAVTGGVFGAAAHGVEKLRGRGARVDMPEPPPGFIVDDAAPAVGEMTPEGRLRVNVTRDVTPEAAPKMVGDTVEPPPGFVLMEAEPAPSVSSEPVIGRVQRMGEGVDPAAALEGFEPEAALPSRPRIARTPEARVETLGEAVKANPGSLVDVPTPVEGRVFDPTDVRTGTGGKIRRAEPLDLVSWLRTQGGLRDIGGELRHSGIDNAPRRMDFAGNEQFLGRLVREDGMTLDDAALKAWEDGFFPGRTERPTVDEFLDALASTHRGESRVFHPDDFDRLAAFEDARRARGAAEQSGGLAEVRGQTAGPDRPFAPVEAYKADLPVPAAKAGNIRLDKLDSPQNIDAALKEVSGRMQGFDEARRGVQRQDQTAALAAEMGMTAADLLKRRKGQALNAEQALAARQLLAKSGNELVNLARRTKGGSDEDLAAFRKALLQHVAIQEQVSGATAEAGRTLAQFRMMANSRDAQRARALEGVVIGGGGRERVEDIAERLSLLDDPAAINDFARKAVKARKRDMLNELWINSLLSGPRTHIVNITGNALTALYTLPEHGLAAGIGRALKTSERAHVREVAKRAIGMMEGAREGLKLAKTAFVTGEPSDAVSKVEAANYHAIPGKLGEVIRIPSRALMAADEFFKAVAKRSEINALAYRHALAASPADRMARYAELRANPTQAMLDAAESNARYLTFQKPLGPGGRAVQQFANEVPLAKLVIPFVRTPINILKFAAERSPLAPGLKEFRDAWKAKGVQRDEALARMIMGSGISMLAVSAALDGKITSGGPSDGREVQALRNSGWQPYSVKIGDRWVSYQRFEPLSLLLGVAADFAEVGEYATEAEADEIALNVSKAVAKNVTSKTWLSGLSDLFEAMSDPDRYGDRFAQRLLSSMAVPSISNQVASASDPYLRDARTLVDTIKARVPVASKSLPARLNVWGEPIERGDAIGPDAISPVWSSRESDSPLLREVGRLRAPLSMPQRRLGEVQLTPQQYAEYVEMSGKPARQYLEGVVVDPAWQELTDAERRKFLRDTMTYYRKEARAVLKARYPDLGGE
jgi:hypothetical protein